VLTVRFQESFLAASGELDLNAIDSGVELPVSVGEGVGVDGSRTNPRPDRDHSYTDPGVA
jgi:hypothetical protein